jgi:hypothetical protein
MIGAILLSLFLIGAPFLIPTANASPPAFSFRDPDHCSKSDIVLRGYFSFDGVDKQTTCDGNQTYCHLFMRGFAFHTGSNITDAESAKIVSNYWNSSDPNSQ